MAPSRRPPETPPCYAMVQLGMERVACDEIVNDHGGEIKMQGNGIIVFRVADITPDLLRLRTTEDVFVYAWGTDALSYRATDLDSIRKWTDRQPDWANLLRIHHGIRPKPKGKPTYRVVVQMNGQHGYRRIDATKSFKQGLAGKLPASWKHADEDASVELWLTINGSTAVSGVRLSDKTMRHRTYKYEHLPASLRPTIAAAMVRMADLKPGQTVLDPMCGAGTLLAEAHLSVIGKRGPDGGAWPMTFLGGDNDPHHVRAALANLRQFDITDVRTWDARKLPIPVESVDRVLCNPPFGKQISTPEEIPAMYRDMIRQMNRVLKPGGKAVIIVSDAAALLEAATKAPWSQMRRQDMRVLGQRAAIFAFRKEPE